MSEDKKNNSNNLITNIHYLSNSELLKTRNMIKIVLTTFLLLIFLTKTSGQVNLDSLSQQIEYANAETQFMFGEMYCFGKGIPIDKKQALEMIKEIKSVKILEGIRGEKPVNINELANLIVKISNLATKEEITEIDLNPVIVDSKKATVVDVRFMV